jgi:hypothetical protein
MKNEKRLYNIILPIWLLIWFPSWLWLIVIPANWLIDWLVTRYALKHAGDTAYVSRSMRLSWKICLAGFISDFVGSLILLGTMYLLGAIGGDLHAIEFGLNWNPFSNIFSVLIILAAILVSAICIYHLDKRILGKENLTTDQAKKTALTLAVVTAPYLYLLPASLFYR